MPYVPQRVREAVAPKPEDPAGTVGELTFQIQQLLKAWLQTHGVRYSSIAECLGALEGAKLDLWDRIGRNYEQSKAQENGDVW